MKWCILTARTLVTTCLLSIGGLAGAWTSYDTVNNLEMVVLPYNPSVTTFTVNIRGARVPASTEYALYITNAW